MGLAERVRRLLSDPNAAGREPVKVYALTRGDQRGQLFFADVGDEKLVGEYVAMALRGGAASVMVGELEISLQDARAIPSYAMVDFWIAAAQKSGGAPPPQQ